MGIMDRDYWREKHNPKKKAAGDGKGTFKFLDRKVEIYNPKAFRGSGKNTTNTYQRNLSTGSVGSFFGRVLNRRTIYLLLLVVMIVSTFVAERSLTVQSVWEKFNIFLQKENGSLIRATARLASSKDIIPGIISTAQTDFKNNFGMVDIEIDLSKATPDGERYSSNHDFYFDTKTADGRNMNGSIAYRVLSLESDKKTLNGKVNLYMWGANSPLQGRSSRMDKQICPSSITRNSDKDDEMKCDTRLAHNISLLVKSDITKPIKLRLVRRDNTNLMAYFIDHKNYITEIGGFKVSKDAQLKNVVTHTLHLDGKISDCAEMKPISFQILSVSNSGLKGSSSIHKADEKFECKDKIKGAINKGKIIQSVVQSSNKPVAFIN